MSFTSNRLARLDLVGEVIFLEGLITERHKREPKVLCKKLLQSLKKNEDTTPSGAGGSCSRRPERFNRNRFGYGI